MSEEPQYFEDGSSLWPLEDGGVVAFSNTGVPIGAQDADGTPIDYREIEPPAELFEDPDEGGYDADPVEEQILELQAWREQIENAPEPVDWYEQGAAASDARADEAWSLDMGRQIRNLEEGVLGRALTQGEVWALLEEARGDYEHGLESDLTAAVERVGITPFAPGRDVGLSETQHGEARRQYLGQLVQDGEREARGQTPDDLPPRMAEDYDLDSTTGDRGHNARVSLAMDSINGHDTEGRTYDSSHTHEED